MRRIKASIDKIRFTLSIFLDATGCLCCDEVGGIAFLMTRFEVLVPVEFPLTRMVEVIKGSVQSTMEMCEAAIQRIVAQAAMSHVPLTNGSTVGISVTSEDICHCLFLNRKSVVAPRWDDRFTNTEAAGITSRHQSASSWGTDRSCVEAVQFYSLSDEPVYVRRRDNAAMIAHIAPSQIVGHNNHHIGLCCCEGVRSGCSGSH